MLDQHCRRFSRREVRPSTPGTDCMCCRPTWNSRTLLSNAALRSRYVRPSSHETCCMTLPPQLSSLSSLTRAASSGVAALCFGDAVHAVSFIQVPDSKRRLAWFLVVLDQGYHHDRGLSSCFYFYHFLCKTFALDLHAFRQQTDQGIEWGSATV